MQCLSNDYNSNSREPLQHIKPQKGTNNLMDCYNVPLSHFNVISNENMDPSQKPMLNEIKSVINNNDNAQIQENEINNLYVRRQHNNNNNKSNNSISKINTNPLQIDIIPAINSANSINSNSNSNSFITNNLLSSASSISSLSSSMSISYSSNNKKKKKKTASLFKKLTNLVTNNKKQEEDEEEEEEDEEEEEEEEIFTPLMGNTPRMNRSSTPMFGGHEHENEYSPQYINEIIGKDTFITDYIYELFEEEKKQQREEQQQQQQQRQQQQQHTQINEKQRQNVIDWICGIGLTFELQRSTIYLSIYYFDKLLLAKEINWSHIQMVTACCLLIAIKWNEKEEKVPSLYKLSRICNKKYAPSSFKPMEITILTALNFKLKIITPLDFVLYYISMGCIFNTDYLDGHCNLHLHNQSNIYLKKFAIFFLDISCQKYSFYHYLPSILAFTVIIASRRALKIEPYFSEKLIKLCHYQPSQSDILINCFNELWLEYNTKFPSDAGRAQKLQSKALREYISNINNKLNGLMQIDST